MVLTPHIRAGQWDNSLGYLRPRFEAFQRLVASKAIDVKLYLGSEVSLQPESLKLLSEGQIPFVGGWDGMKVMLLDFPDARIPPNAIGAVRYLVRQGVLPMVAHPERLSPFSSADLAAARELTGGVEVSDDDILPDDVTI